MQTKFITVYKYNISQLILIIYSKNILNSENEEHYPKKDLNYQKYFTGITHNFFKQR